MEHKQDPGGDGEGVEDSRLQQVYHQLHTTTWRPTYYYVRGKPKTRHSKTPRTRTCPRTKKTQDLGVTHGPVWKDKPDTEGATTHLVIKTREDKEVEVVEMTQLGLAECV